MDTLTPLPALSRIAALALVLAFASASRAATVLATGTFQSKESGIAANGGFEVVEDAGKFTLNIKGDFQVSEGPDLFFAFHPLAAAAVTGGNAKTGALRIDPKLKSLSGAQSYPLPAGFDLAAYGSLIVHCWKYNHLYAAAAMVKTAPTSTRIQAPGQDKGPAIGCCARKIQVARGAADTRRYGVDGRLSPAGR